MHDRDDLKIVGRAMRAKARLRDIFWNPATVANSLDSLLGNLLSEIADEILGAIDAFGYLFELYDVWDIAYEGRTEELLEDELESLLDDEISFEIPAEFQVGLHHAIKQEADNATDLIAELSGQKSLDEQRREIRIAFLEAFSRKGFKLVLINRLFDIMFYTSDRYVMQAASRLAYRTVENSTLTTGQAGMVERSAEAVLKTTEDTFAIWHLQEVLRLCKGKIIENG